MMDLRTTFYAVAWSGLLGLTGCTSNGEDRPRPAAETPGAVHGTEETEAGSAAWKLVDAAVREQGKIVGYGDLTAGLAELEKDFRLTITDSGDHWSVQLWPHSGAGHDFSFGVMKDTGEMVDVMIGSIFPMPPPPE